MRIRFVFHNPTGERGIGKAIVGWTWLLAFVSLQWKRLKYDYSHEEIWMPWDDKGETDSWRMHPDFGPYLGQCFSSTTRGGARGVRFASASAIIGKHPERWDYIECEVDAERLEVAVEEAGKLVGRGYDYLGLFGFFQPLVIQDDKKWYCSEICDWFKFLVRVHPKRHKRISPRRAAHLLAEKYGEPVPV